MKCRLTYARARLESIARPRENTTPSYSCTEQAGNYHETAERESFCGKHLDWHVIQFLELTAVYSANCRAKEFENIQYRREACFDKFLINSTLFCAVEVCAVNYFSYVQNEYDPIKLSFRYRYFLLMIFFSVPYMVRQKYWQ